MLHVRRHWRVLEHIEKGKEYQMEGSLIPIVLGGSAVLGLLVTLIEIVREVRLLAKQRRQHEMMRHSWQLSKANLSSNDLLHQQRITYLEQRIAYLEHYLGQIERFQMYDARRRAAPLDMRQFTLAGR